MRRELAVGYRSTSLLKRAGVLVNEVLDRTRAGECVHEDPDAFYVIDLRGDRLECRQVDRDGVASGAALWNGDSERGAPLGRYLEVIASH